MIPFETETVPAHQIRTGDQLAYSDNQHVITQVKTIGDTVVAYHRYGRTEIPRNAPVKIRRRPRVEVLVTDTAVEEGRGPHIWPVTASAHTAAS